MQSKYVSFINKHKENMTAPTRDGEACCGDWLITRGNRLVMDFLVFKPQLYRRLSRIFFSASSRLSRYFRGRLAGLAKIAAGGRLSQRLRGLPVRLRTRHVESAYTGGSK